MPAATSPASPPLLWSPRLVLWHWLGARAAMLCLCVLVWREPEAVFVSPLHPTTLACAHLTVLGFLAVSIAGAFHAMAPLVLRLHLRADWRDWTLLAALVLAASGVASHLLLGTYSGVAWSGGLLLVAVLLRLPAWLRALRNSRLPGAIATGVAMALAALPLTIGLGITVSVNYARPILPASRWQALVGHSHLGAGGFALLMSMALGQRLLPMLLPAAPPAPWVAWATVGLTALGAYGMGVTMPFWPVAGPAFGLVLAAGVLTFLSSCVWMLRHSKPAPRELKRRNPERVLLVTAMVSLSAALILGVLLNMGAIGQSRAQLAYGLLGLLAGLGSLVLGIGARILPLVGWHAARLDRSSEERPTAPHMVGSLPLQWTVVLAWLVGLALLLMATATATAGVARAGAAALALAMIADIANLLRGWRHRRRA